MHKTLFALMCYVSFLYAEFTHAGIVITGTRVIYPADKEFIPLQISNMGKKAALAQFWIDDENSFSEPTTTETPFFITPPISVIEPNQGQALRILFNHAKQLPTDRETMFWLNVLDIPTKPENLNNYLQFAVRNRLKLFYRPTLVTSQQQQQAFQNIQIIKSQNTLIIHNPSPFYLNFSRSKLMLNNGESNELKQLTYLKPFSKQEFQINNLGLAQSIHFALINDYGALVNIEKNFN